MKAAMEMAGSGRVGQGLLRLVRKLERQAALDGVSEPLASAVKKLTGPDVVKNILSGASVGHQLHPILTDLPIGFWSSAVVLDLLGGKKAEAGADTLVISGSAAALGAAATGLADWSDLYGPPQRVGLVHAGINIAALSLMAMSSAARAAGARGAGKFLALAGLGVTSAAAYLGGDLVYRHGAGVTHAGFDLDDQLSEWHAVCQEKELASGKPLKADAGGLEVFLVKDGTGLRALANHCNHMGGPLDEGEVRDGTVVCPWHGSTFQLTDGCVMRGPAAMPQPTFETRVVEGRVEVRAM
jgi:nitrite reductase/ring-hydroxylating ferredoxin subunit/uncharacterized membrane protein